MHRLLGPAEQPHVPGDPTHDPTQHVSAALIGRHNTIAHQKSARASVVSDDAQGGGATAAPAVAEKGLARETGARGLRSIIEEILLEVQFELPSRRDVKKCVVTKETVERGLTPTLVTEAAPEESREDAPREQSA